MRGSESSIATGGIGGGGGGGGEGDGVGSLDDETNPGVDDDGMRDLKNVLVTENPLEE